MEEGDDVLCAMFIDPFRRLDDDSVKPVPPEGWTLPFPGTAWSALRPLAGRLPSPGSSDVALLAAP